MRNRNLVLLTSAFMLLLLGLGMTSGYAASITNPQPLAEREGQRGSWRYRAAVDRTEGRIVADVTYALETIAQVEVFVATQRQLADELVAVGESTLDATIVFRHPLSHEAFEQFVTSYRLVVSGYTLRFVDNQGQRVTITGGPDNGILVPQDLLNLALADIQHRSPGNLRGWIEVRAIVPSQTYKSLVDDSQVYLVDVSRSVIRAAFKDHPQAQELPVDILTPQIYWKLEDLGLVVN